MDGQDIELGQGSTIAAKSATNLILIDNYDSFTYNVYQYLVLEGACVTVYRNDEILLDELIKLKPTQLVISPGPGNPEEDAGISDSAIRHFAGKIPVLGVCMGQQCIYTAFGGKVEVTGEILHGKTSPLKHDSKGVYHGLAQGLPVTRYHSLAGTRLTLPDCLEVSSWIEKGSDQKNNVIMGVRHKIFTVEGMQFHPESILTAEGRTMIRNFLEVTGGTWRDASGTLQRDTVIDNKKLSILDEIFESRKHAVAQLESTPSYRLNDLQAAYDLQLCPPQIDFARRLRKSPFSLSLLAEVKRASPSKGDIASDICAPAQAWKYALAGASVISVLSEPKYFKGSIDDLRLVRQRLEALPDRPAVLRKDFIFNQYQILEARLAGADTVLLIVKMLSAKLLRELYEYSQSLGMEPLVEVNTLQEMEDAVKLGAKVIGVNNRDLTSFEVDLETTNRFLDVVPSDVIICALSGISGSEDVRRYQDNKVSAVLIGEALMRCADVSTFVRDTLKLKDDVCGGAEESRLLVKICGTRTPEAAKAAIEAGADLIGIILVEGRTRFVPNEAALAISKTVHQTPRPAKYTISPQRLPQQTCLHPERLLRHTYRALLVGVFRNQSLDYILDQQRRLDLDIVQLHGNEPIEWASQIPVPVIRRFAIDDIRMRLKGYHVAPLLDSSLGGTGETLNLADLKRALEKDNSTNVILAGGLNPENIGPTLDALGPLRQHITAVDVSSGVEVQGVQDHTKIASFVANARKASAGNALSGYRVPR